MRFTKHPLLAAVMAALWFWTPVLQLHAVPLWTSGSAAGDEDAPPPPPPDYTVNTAVFDGTNDYIRSDNLGSTGLADGTVFTAAFWLKFNAVNTTYFVFDISTGGSSPRLQLFVSSTGSVARFRAYNSSSVAVADLSGSQSLSSGTWNHIFWCVDTASSANTKLYVNGVEDTSLVETTLSGTMDLVVTGQRMTVGGGGSGSPSNRLAGSSAELWLNDIYLDNVALFYASGNPVNLGPNGVTPTGGQPCIYFSGNGSGDSWTAQGTAGTWTITGPLGTDTSP